MITIPMIDDDGQAVRHDYSTEIDAATRAKNYKARSADDLGQLNWKLNQIEANWGNYAADTSAGRAVLVPTDALLAFRANIEALRTTWATIQQHQAAGRILFADAIAKTGRDEILFSLESVLMSPELTAVLGDLTTHKLRHRLGSWRATCAWRCLMRRLSALPARRCSNTTTCWARTTRSLLRMTAWTK